VDIETELASFADLAAVPVSLKFAENENPTPADRVFFRYDFRAGDLESRGPTWRLTDATRSRTGIEQFMILETTGSSPHTLSMTLTDSGAQVPDVDYSHLCVTLSIGPHSGSTCVRMQPAGNIWTVVS